MMMPFDLYLVLETIDFKMKDLLTELNTPQQMAVTKTEGPLLILAGAGSGKTRVITYRIAYLIQELNVHPRNICAVTFTNKAAKEMRERVDSIVGHSARDVTIKTFHSLCLSILRSNTELCGLKSGFTVYDSSLQESLIKEICRELNVDNKEYPATKIANTLNQAKDSNIEPLKSFKMDIDSDKTIQLIFEKYEAAKQTRNAVDFGDLILKTVQLFLKNSDVLERYNRFWKYIMVDEYQDTNKLQYQLSRCLAGEQKNLCVVGDDDQSIYSWRGADIRNILEFELDYPEAFIVKLEENYRSTSNIIEAAKNVISNNTQRKQKEVFSQKESGEKILFTEYQNEYEEAETIADAIKELNKSTKTYSSFAIFYRTNAQSRYFEEAVRMRGIPYKIFGGFRFYDRAEIKDMIAYLSILINSYDSTSLLRIINTPIRGIGDTSIDKIRELSIAEGISLFEALNHPFLDLKKAALSSVRQLYKHFIDLIDMNEAKVSPSEIAKKLVDIMGIHEHYSKGKNIEDRDKLENISEFINSIIEYEENTEEPDLSEYLNQITLLTSEEDNSKITDFVHLMTVHNAKGLEFDYVFLSGMAEDIFPHFMSNNSKFGIEEERRLCYVAITRAKKQLFISSPEYTRYYGSVNARNPSRFLNEIPRELMEFGVLEVGVTKRKPKSPPLSSNKSGFSDTTNVKSEAKEQSTKIQVGSKVRHKNFGVGKVIEVSGTGDNKMVKIKFGPHLEKKFMLLYTPLEIL